jgi:transposase-like protein
MTKTEQNRVLAWRLKVLQEASVMPRNVAQACRHFGLSRKTFYKWNARYKSHGEAGLCDRPRVPLHSPRATPRAVISTIDRDCPHSPQHRCRGPLPPVSPRP